MRIFDRLRWSAKQQAEQDEYAALLLSLDQYASAAKEWRERMCVASVLYALKLQPDQPLPTAAAPAVRLCDAMLHYEGYLHIPEVKREGLTLAEMWEAKAAIKEALNSFEDKERLKTIGDTLSSFIQCLVHGMPRFTDSEEGSVTVPLYAFLSEPAASIQAICNLIFSDKLCDANLFNILRSQISQTVCAISGIETLDLKTSWKRIVHPVTVDKPAPNLINMYFANTPFLDFLFTPIPFSIPFPARFEHTHIVGGSGHGKTQLLQHLILKDLTHLLAGQGSIVVIDSQGDMIHKILHLAEMADISDRLVLIDPNDIDYPPALNLFDFGLDRLTRYSPVEREKLVNGAIALYEYLFGALLGAELTQKQGVIFRYLSRLMMVVPGATIHTLMEFMEDPRTTKPHLAKLDRLAKHFFESQFFSPAFDSTRQQILTRLWGVLSNSVLERMFGNPRNKLDLYDAMNRGSVILINTAKDLLKQEGCEILGRFFIALISQAAQERAAIPEDRRRSTFVYIDEAADYFDEGLESINQLRKYKIGCVLAHQNLDQLDQKLRATVMASTSIKLVGGLSAKDAVAFAKEMHCDPDFLQGMRKTERFTSFACFIRSHTPRPITLAVPLGEMERRLTLDPIQFERILQENRGRYASEGFQGSVDGSAGETGVEDPDLL